ncbi:MAG: MBL fold metallo-hydrolase [Gemmatimonadota bacterium]|jgi:glyoxylase-like metal-dependent hydrolase (beta-lactamase superfamily II)|nr:MBL fold metallo-hydrolase [Gemmatimonadota bacterium]
MKPRWLIAPNPSSMTLDGTRTFIVGRSQPAVIDPGPDIEAHINAIVRLLDGATPVMIVVTHNHPDHSAAAASLARITGAPIHPGGPCRIRTDMGEIDLIPTPGHTPDHLIAVWPAGRAVFVGDLLMGAGDTTLVAPPEGNLGDYLRSLDVLEALVTAAPAPAESDPAAGDPMPAGSRAVEPQAVESVEAEPVTLYPAHGPPITDPVAAIARYRRHRLERIRRVREALAEGLPSDPEALLDRIYGAGLDSRLRDAARGSLAAILEYINSR